jgi:NifB/MoaA-like Fe-S oxidoreductase
MEIGGRDPDWASGESAGSPREGRRNAMDLNLTGTEVHELREILETVISEMERKIVGLGDPEAGEELERRKDVLRSIREKLPAGLIETA